MSDKNLRLEKLFAYTQIDADGNERLIGMKHPSENYWVPMVGADKERIYSLKTYAALVATKTKNEVFLKEFKNCKIREKILPDLTPEKISEMIIKK